MAKKGEIEPKSGKRGRTAEELKEIGAATQWKAGQSGNPKGRPKKYLNRFTELGTNYTKGQVRDTISSFAGLTKKELKKIISDKESTILEETIAATYLEGSRKKNFSFVQSMIELFADKAVQHNVTKIDANVKYAGMDDEQLAEMEARLLAGEGITNLEDEEEDEEAED